MTQARRAGRGRAIELSRAVIDDPFSSGEMIYRGPATTVLVEALLRRGSDADLQDARAAIDRLVAVPTEPGFVVHQLTLLRLRAGVVAYDSEGVRLVGAGGAEGPRGYTPTRAPGTGR